MDAIEAANANANESMNGYTNSRMALTQAPVLEKTIMEHRRQLMTHEEIHAMLRKRKEMIEECKPKQI